MNMQNKNPIKSLPWTKRSSSCEELPLVNRDSQTTSCSSSSVKSTDDLPASVAECFQDSSFIGRMQNSLFHCIGRGSRYKIQHLKRCSFLSMITKEKEDGQLLVPSIQNNLAKSTLVTPPSKTPLHQANSLPVRSKASIYSTRQQIKEMAQQQKDKSDNFVEAEENKKLYTERSERLYSCKQEETLWQQYLSLQQLAVARRHCNQLRRIRDSLIGRSHPKNKNMSPSKEQEELRNFLLDVGFVQYYALLNRHGYDFATASHMDVLDLAAVGINEPLHRMALKYELDQVRSPIKPLEKIPETVSEWLANISLSEYTEHFQRNGIYCPLAAVGLTKRDLQFMGIYLLGHRKKLVLALTAVHMGLSFKKLYEYSTS